MIIDLDPEGATSGSVSAIGRVATILVKDNPSYKSLAWARA